MTDDKVLPFPLRIKETRPVSIAPPTGGCQHRNATVDYRLAEVTCSDCGEKLNAVWFLTLLAQDWRRMEWQREDLEKARAALAERSRCRCLKCGEWTDIRTVHNREVARIKRNARSTGPHSTSEET